VPKNSRGDPGGHTLKQQETVCTIAAADLKSGEFGIAVASSSLAVGKNVPFTRAHVGAIAVQGYASPFFGIAGMKFLRDGVHSHAVIENVMAGDPLKEHRQMLVIDVTGKPAVFTGSEVSPFCGSHQGENYAVAGCGLLGQAVIDGCAKAFEETQGDLAGRLVAALAAAEKASGDSAPFESAAVRISKDNPYPYLDLRIDRHADPVTELARLLEMWRTKTAAAV
jgi:uncharacterized Ntn-hydrolase superfamily protein